MMKRISEEVCKLINDVFEKSNKKKLNESQESLLKSLIVDISSKNLLENSVYKLLCNKIL